MVSITMLTNIYLLQVTNKNMFQIVKNTKASNNVAVFIVKFKYISNLSQ